jgi:hypothetical protein
MISSRLRLAFRPRFLTRLAGALLVALTCVTYAGAAEPVVFRRFALVISSNDGGPGRTVLRFADSDATHVAGVLESLGGVEKRDLVEVRRASRAAVRASFAELRERLRPIGSGPRPRNELFVYYSGHSDEEGLLLGNERVSYRELRTWIEETGADVRIAVLDSCASGALVRLRGGVHRPPFLSDVSAQTRGHAYLTASSADEAAQESDRIGSAFFTYYLLSGLRGAADANRDRRVTLNEAYHFAYSETLRRTEGSIAGAQHPAYDIQLAGTGDLVITDLRAPRARLVLPETLAGRIYVRDEVGRLVAELRKEPTYPVELGLEPGNYRVVLDKDGRAGEAAVSLTEGVSLALAEDRFTALPTFVATARGDGPAGADAEVRATAPAGAPPAAPAAAEPPLVTVPFEVGIWPSLRAHRGERVRNRFVFGLLVGSSDVLDGLQLSLLGSVTEERMNGAQISDAFNLARGTSEGAQIAAGVNISTGTFTGLQLAPINVAWGTFKGAEIGVVNVASGDVPDGRPDAAQTFVGPQIGVVNVQKGKMQGLELGVTNVSLGELEGSQIGVVNVSQSQRGMALGVVNVGVERQGVGVGVVNVARKQKGFTLGLINVAAEAEGESLAFLFNWANNGIHVIDAFATELTPLNLGIKTGTRHLYTQWELGWSPGDAGNADDPNLTRGSARYALGIGFGWRGQPSARTFVDVGIMSQNVRRRLSRIFHGDENTTLGSLRVTAGYRLMPHLAVMGGLTYNVAVGWDGANLDVGPSWADSTRKSGDTTIHMYPGFVAGLEI